MSQPFPFATGLDLDFYQSIWTASLETVPEPKVREREAWDLFQCLDMTWDWPGDCVEFGTYRGHSGWLMAEFLRRCNSAKHLWLFDTFDCFPEEEGEDTKWSGTHHVDFAEVQELFAPFENVHLVQGDFTETAREIDLDPGFVHVDCDSYRGTYFAAKWTELRDSLRPIVLFQDYGQPQCEGARRAVDEFLPSWSWHPPHWFSFYSGSMVVWMVWP